MQYQIKKWTNEIKKLSHMKKIFEEKQKETCQSESSGFRKKKYVRRYQHKILRKLIPARAISKEFGNAELK